MRGDGYHIPAIPHFVPFQDTTTREMQSCYLPSVISRPAPKTNHYTQIKAKESLCGKKGKSVREASYKPDQDDNTNFTFKINILHLVQVGIIFSYFSWVNVWFFPDTLSTRQKWSYLLMPLMNSLSVYRLIPMSCIYYCASLLRNLEGSLAGMPLSHFLTLKTTANTPQDGQKTSVCLWIIPHFYWPPLLQ